MTHQSATGLVFRRQKISKKEDFVRKYRSLCWMKETSESSGNRALKQNSTEIAGEEFTAATPEDKGYLPKR